MVESNLDIVEVIVVVSSSTTVIVLTLGVAIVVEHECVLKRLQQEQ